MYVTGGHSEVYYTNRLIQTPARSDVWRSSDGSAWEQVVAEAPWKTRYGHSLTPFTPTGGSEMLVLMGGYSPIPSNDVWITTDGETWEERESVAPWSGRAWHCSAVFNDKLWIMGGSPINNDIWYTSTLSTGNIAAHIF